MKAIDQKILKKFIKIAGDKLNGRWILIGGTVLPLLGIEHRVTTDIDFVGPATAPQSEVLKLMEIAEQLGLPVESINQAGAYFLRKISGFEKHLVEVHKGKSATIYRPDVTLFLKLKMARLSETDLEDCLQLLKTGEKFEPKEVAANINKELKIASVPDRKQRLQRLLDAVSRKS